MDNNSKIENPNSKLVRILLIEDNPGDARLVRELLKETRGDFEIDAAEKLGAGLEFLLSHDVDVILLDLNLPDSGGLDTITKLLNRFSHIPIVTMTSIDDEELARQAVRLGAQDYLVKGTVVGELLRRTLLYAIERKRTEEELRKSQELLQAVSEGTEDAIFVKDRESRLLLANPAVERIVGKPASEILGKNDAELYSDPEIGRSVMETDRRIMESGTSEVVEERIQSPQGYRTFLSTKAPLRDNRGRVIGLIGVARDITERKRAEEMLQKAHDELQAANAGLRDSRRAALNLMEDSVTAHRHAEEAAAGLQHSLQRFELLAQTAGELLQATEPQKAVESICRKVMKFLDCHAFFNFLVDEQAGKLHLSACAGVPEEEAKRIEWLDFGVAICGCVARDGQRIVAENISRTPDERTELLKSYGINAYCCHPLLGPGGKVIGTLSFGTCSRESFSEEDLSLMKAVTDQVAAAMVRIKNEEEVLRLSEDMASRNVELEEANKELETFSYAVSHDLKAPLRSIKGFTQAIADDYVNRLDDAGRDYFRRVIAASERMTQLIDAMLAMSRFTRREPEKQIVNLSDIARVVASELKRREPERQVEVIIADAVRAKGDHAMLEAVMENLLSNAWKFTSHHASAKIEFGTIDCGMGNAECGTEPTPTPLPRGDSELIPNSEIVYFVRDDGAGFAMEFADKLFTPFRRLHTESEFPGIGIGLATVHRIIRRHGGRIWAEGAPGKGATFYFTLE